MSVIRNTPSPDGRELGARMAKWCDEAEPQARLLAPDIPPRCASCAFRHGDHLANTSPYTQMDILKSVIERQPFYCHDVHREDEFCSGWAMMLLADDRATAGIELPWDFTEGAAKP